MERGISFRFAAAPVHGGFAAQRFYDGRGATAQHSLLFCDRAGGGTGAGDSFIWAAANGMSNDDLITILAGAMGIQTVTVTRVAGLRIYTTYLTGSLTKLAEAVVRYTFWFRDRTRGRLRRRLAKVLRVMLLASLWVGFFGGAYSGTAMESAVGLYCLGARQPCCCLRSLSTCGIRSWRRTIRSIGTICSAQIESALQQRNARQFAHTPRGAMQETRLLVFFAPERFHQPHR